MGVPLIYNPTPTLSLDFTLLYNVCFTIIFYIEGGFNQWKKQKEINY